jgi:hypothetical protein
MKLSHLHIANYRGLKDIKIPLSRFVCIIGENNGGKSSVLQALSLFLSGSPIRRTDFYDEGKQVTIVLKIEGVTDEDLDLLEAGHRVKIRELIVNGTLILVRQYDLDGRSQLGTFNLVPQDQRFTEENISNLLKGTKGPQVRKAVIAKFPELSRQLTGSLTQGEAKEAIQKLANSLPDSAKETQFIALPTGLDKSITPMLPERIYIPAVKDLADDTKTTESTPFGKILAIVTKAIEPLLTSERDVFDELSRKLTRIVTSDGSIRDERLGEIVNIERTIEKYVRESFRNVKLELEIPPPDLKTVLSSARILADDGVKSSLDMKGDGLRRAVVFAVLRAYIEFSRASSAKDKPVNLSAERGYLFLFEEPELFLHPTAQRILFDALGEFSKKHHVVVTTHSPLFLGPRSTATFIRLSKPTDKHAIKPHTKACHIELTDLSPRDEFQIICFENNSAAFFAKRVVLVEGDSDYITFPHIAETLDTRWNCHTSSVAFVRVGGKGSIARYRRFFKRFDVPVFVITDLDTLDDDFEKLEPDTVAASLREKLRQLANEEAKALGPTALPSSPAITKAQGNLGLKQLWEKVRLAKDAFDVDKSKFAELDAAVEEFFSWERKSVRRDIIRKAEIESIRTTKLNLIWQLRNNGVFVLERGALEDYYPAGITGADKPSRAQAFVATCNTRESVIALCPKQICPNTGEERAEFEFMCAAIFDKP